jgi:hypothetical protein
MCKVVVSTSSLLSYIYIYSNAFVVYKVVSTSVSARDLYETQSALLHCPKFDITWLGVVRGFTRPRVATSRRAASVAVNLTDHSTMSKEPRRTHSFLHVALI